MSKNRTLILCVDRDDDIGYKGDIKSPVIGREKCIHTANVLGLVDPEDSDVNAIFQAVKTYDELARQGEDVVIAILSGDHIHTLEGDRKLAEDLDTVIRETGVSGCILVTDGAEDEFVLPIIQSRLPVDSIRRVIVKQMPNLEGTYYILKKVFEDPKIARQVFVPVGMAMLLYAVAFILGYPEVAVILVVGVIGTYLLFKGFGIDEVFNYFVSALQASFQGGRVTFVSYIAAIFLVIVGIAMGLSSILEWYTADAGILYYLISFIYGSVFWFTSAGLVASMGKIIDIFLNEPDNLGKAVVIPFFLIAIGIIGYGASVYTLSISGNLNFPLAEDDGIRTILITTLGGLGFAFFGVYVQKIVSRWMGSQIRLRSPKDEIESEA